MSVPAEHEALARRAARRAEAVPARKRPPRRRAAVAVILRPGARGDEVLLIRRQERPGDRWSGHVAFPGGWCRHDEEAEAGAARETAEEVGLDLLALGGRRLGRLPDRPRAPFSRWVPFVVTPTLWSFRGDPPLRLEPTEVVEARWVPLRELAAPSARARFWWWWRPWKRLPLPLPFRMPELHVRGLRIWGMTLDMLDELLELHPPDGRARSG